MILNETAEAYIEEYRAAQAINAELEKMNSERQESIRLRHEELLALQAWIKAQPGAERGFTEEEWAAMIPRLQYEKEQEHYRHAMGAKAKELTLEQQLESTYGLKGFQHGGIIMEPTLLTRLRDMKPYAIAGERGPEPVIGSGGITVISNTYLDGELISRQIENKVVNRTRLQRAY